MSHCRGKSTRQKLQQAVDAAFEPAEAMTAAFVVTWKGQLIAERYGPGITAHTPFKFWSMGKSMIAALFGILVKQGDYDLSQPAPIPEWQAPDDPLQKFGLPTFSTCRAGYGSKRRRIPITILRVRIPTTFTCTPEA